MLEKSKGLAYVAQKSGENIRLFSGRGGGLFWKTKTEKCRFCAKSGGGGVPVDLYTVQFGKY